MALNPEQREQFRSHLSRWQERLNLGDWRIPLSPRFAQKGAMADVKISLPARTAVVKLGSMGWNVPTPHLLESTAVHELLHVLLSELIEFAKDPHITDDNLSSLEHRVITVLEGLLVPLLLPEVE